MEPGTHSTHPVKHHTGPQPIQICACIRAAAGIGSSATEDCTSVTGPYPTTAQSDYYFNSDLQSRNAGWQHAETSLAYPCLTPPTLCVHCPSTELRRCSLGYQAGSTPPRPLSLPTRVCQVLCSPSLSTPHPHTQALLLSACLLVVSTSHPQALLLSACLSWCLSTRTVLLPHCNSLPELPLRCPLPAFLRAGGCAAICPSSSPPHCTSVSPPLYLYGGHCPSTELANFFSNPGFASGASIGGRGLYC